MKTIDSHLAEQPADKARRAERHALVALQGLAEKIRDEDASKLAALVAQLRELGVGPGSDTRVVIFSERIPTLNWLAEAVPAALGFRTVELKDNQPPWAIFFDGAVQVMHGDSTNDEEQQRIVELFGLRDNPVRLLFTGDIASEGVNLHQQCHILIHYDLPWSLIRIEQRNGRIDRYGQRHAPQFRALVLTSDLPWRTDPDTGKPRTLDDRLVGEHLLRREAEAHKIEGSVEAVTGLYRAQEEENRLVKDLMNGRTVEQSIAKSRAGRTGFLARIVGQVGAVPERPEVRRANVLSLFTSAADYFDEGLRQICGPIPRTSCRSTATTTAPSRSSHRRTCSTGFVPCRAPTCGNSKSCRGRTRPAVCVSPSPRSSPTRASRSRGRAPTRSGPPCRT